MCQRPTGAPKSPLIHAAKQQFDNNSLQKIQEIGHFSHRLKNDLFGTSEENSPIITLSSWEPVKAKKKTP